jgi:hypothetical protein
VDALASVPPSRPTRGVDVANVRPCSLGWEWATGDFVVRVRVRHYAHDAGEVVTRLVQCHCHCDSYPDEDGGAAEPRAAVIGNPIQSDDDCSYLVKVTDCTVV